MFKNPDVYAKTLYNNGLTCENIVQATDRVQTVVRISNTIREIWDASRCEGSQKFILIFSNFFYSI